MSQANAVRPRGLRFWVAGILAALLALTTFSLSSPAEAKEVSPTTANVTLTDTAGNVVTQVTNGQTYKVAFDASFPAGIQPGDTFTVTLPEGFESAQTDASLGQYATAKGSGRTVTVTFTDAVAGKGEIDLGFSSLLKYTGKSAENTEVGGSMLINNIPTYFPVVKYVGPPPGPEMIINKWSGNSTDSTNAKTAKALKLQSAGHNYGWIKPGDGQVFAHWFVELNNWQQGKPQDIGQKIVVTDTLQNLGDFTPVIEPNPDAGTPARNIESRVLEGAYLAPLISVAVRDNGTTTTYPDPVKDQSTFGQPYLQNFATYTKNADGTTTMKFRVSDYLDSIGVHPSDTAQYAINYFTVLPEQSANVTNDASFTSTKFEEPQSDSGYYRYVDSNGWSRAAQPTTSLTINKQWKDSDGNDLAQDKIQNATFELLADGEPAKDVNGIDGEVLADQKVVFTPGTTKYTWTNLPTQSAEGKAITYTVKETPIEGFTTVNTGSFVPNLSDTSNIPAGELTITNTADPVTETPTATPTTEEPTEEPTADAPTSDEPSTETPSAEPSTEAPSEKPTTEAPTTEAPATDEPTSEAPARDDPTAEAPSEQSSDDDTPDSGSSSNLPRTGASVGGSVAVASLLIAAGVFMIRRSRRNS